MKVLNYHIWGDVQYIVAENMYRDIQEQLPDVVNLFAAEEYYVPDFYYYRVPDKINVYAREHNIQINYLFGGSDLNWYTEIGRHLYHQPEHNINVYLWPDVYFKIAYYNLAVNRFFTRPTLPFKYDIICLNGNVRPHRSKLVDVLAKHHLINENAISWTQLDRHYEWKYWDQKLLTLTEPEHEDDLGRGYDEHSPCEEWYESFLHVVTETSIHTTFITEKTTMCLFGKKLFISWAAPNFHYWLANLGFKLYDEVIDYTFDTIEDNDRRLELLMNEVIKLINFDHHIIYNTIKEKLEYNFQLALQLATETAIPNLVYQYNVPYYDRLKRINLDYGEWRQELS